jgi:integrase
LIPAYAAALSRRRLSPNTVKLRTFYITKVQDLYGDLTRVTFDQLEAYVFANKAWSENTQQSAVASIRSFYQWAYVNGLIEKNPADDLSRIRVHRRPSRIATDAAIRAGLEVATVEEQAMILLGAECGLRVSEIAGLHRDNRDGEWITVIGKGNKQRSVFCSPELGALLDTIERTSIRWGYYFPGRSGGHAHPSMVWRHITNLIHTNPHALRHRAGTTVWRETGHDLRTTQEFLGHSRPETTAIYVHVEREDLRKAGAAARMAA